MHRLGEGRGDGGWSLLSQGTDTEAPLWQSLTFRVLEALSYAVGVDTL